MTQGPWQTTLLPLERGDPPALGGIELTGRLAWTASGVVYAGRLGHQPVTVVALNEGAEKDSYARARFQEAAHTLGPSRPDGVVATERDDVRAAETELVGAAAGTAAMTAHATVIAGESDVDIAPWVAVSANSRESELAAALALLAHVAMDHVPPMGEPAGPGFRPHWSARATLGRWRMWPLPWPSALTTASRWTYVAAFALVLTVAAIALWIAVKLFEGQPAVPPGPGPGPVPLPPSPSSPSSPSPTPVPTPSPTPSPPTEPGSPSSSGVPPIV